MDRFFFRFIGPGTGPGPTFFRFIGPGTGPGPTFFRSGGPSPGPGPTFFRSVGPGPGLWLETETDLKDRLFFVTYCMLADKNLFSMNVCITSITITLAITLLLQLH